MVTRILRCSPESLPTAFIVTYLRIVPRAANHAFCLLHHCFSQVSFHPTYAILPSHTSLQSHSSLSHPFFFQHWECRCLLPALKYSRPSSAHSPPVQDILFPGDIISQGLDFCERVLLLPVSASHRNGHDELNTPSIKFEVVRALGTGSCAVVYQVRQILSGSPPLTENFPPISAVNFDDISELQGSFISSRGTRLASPNPPPPPHLYLPAA